MDNRYKMIISNNHLYKEVELSNELQQLKIGTGVDCDVRLHKELFFGKIELLLVKNNGEWTIHCSENLYLSVGDIRKLMMKGLKHGETIEVRYVETGNLVFSFDFSIDFNDGKKKYERIIDIQSVQAITIGCDERCNIVVKSPYVSKDLIQITKSGWNYTLKIKHTTYGIYVNGNKVGDGFIIKNGDFFSISDYFFYLKDHQIWTEIRGDLSVNGLNYQDKITPNNYPKFKRNTRVKTVVCDEKIPILDPPNKPEKPKNNLFTRLLPSFAMLIAAGAMAFIGGTMIIMSAISATVGIVTTVISIRENKKDYQEAVVERIEKYNAYIKKKKADIEKFRLQEREEREEIYISQEELIQRFDEFSPDLFDRIAEDEDFLCICLGCGDAVAQREIDFKKQEKLEIEDELQVMPEEIFEKYKYVQNAPIICDLKEMNALGIVGSNKGRDTFLKNIVVDLVGRQYYTEVKLFFVAEKEHRKQLEWLRLLPHTYNDSMGIKNVVTDDESKNLIFEYLYKEISIRENKKEYEEIIVFLFDEYGFKSHPISQYVDKASSLGITFIFFANKVEELSQGCGYIIEILNETEAVLINSQNKSDSYKFKYPSVSDARVEGIANILAPVYTEEISLEGTLTKNISLFELLNILAVDDLNLNDRWRKSQVYNTMFAPVGVSKTGIVYLDLHDSAHGPHGLVAGTTGSGKSEILQTYILAMATMYHPYEVGFAIIDFKGGGMVNQFKDLPHLLGAITNIDGKEINRSLKSIKAELKKRQRLFAELDVNHIDKYIKKYKMGEAKIALPHLIIIVDEFAELKAEQPEFMKELISAARIGRSLGVHLILATQKPSGQVNEQIWSNSKFKLCLKVQSQADSNEVLKSPLAAEIKEPGRAYLQVGNNEIFELFQSAYSGAPEKMDDSNIKEFTIFNLAETGKRIPVYTQKKKKSGEGSRTQLDAIVSYVSEYFEGTKLKQLPSICLPSLAETIDFVSTKEKPEVLTEYEIGIGIYDDPDNQYQGEYSIDVGSNNLFILGTSQSGKTNILQSMIRSIATKYTPEEAIIYIIDFASMVLKNFEKLNHVGGVVCPSDDEKLKNLFKLLRTEVEKRKEKLVSVGVSSFTAYKEAGGVDLPLIVLMIDNFSALKELYFNDDDELLNLCREGLSVGLSVVVANPQTAGLGYKYLATFSNRIALYCNDTNEYSTVFDHCRERVEAIPGRCLVELEKEYLDCHAYLAFKGEKEIDRVTEIKKFISVINSKNRDMIAPKIPLIPQILLKEYMIEQFSNYMNKEFTIVSGLDYATITPKVIDFASLGMIAIAGREKSGKHNWLRYSLDMLNEMYPNKSQVYLVDSIAKKLAGLKEEENICKYSMIADDAAKYIIEMEEILKARYDALVLGDEEPLNNGELLVLVVDNYDGLVSICNDKNALAAYKNITGRYKNMKVCIIAFIENANIAFSAPEILKNIKEQRHLMYFDDINTIKIFDVPLMTARQFKKPIEMGDGYYIRDSEYVKLKTPMSVQDVKL